MAWTSPSVQTTGTVINATIWNRDVTDNLAFLGATHNHSGDAGDGATLTGVPSGLIVMFDVPCPTGWTRVSAWDDKFIRGAATYDAVGGGAATHTHYFLYHDHAHTHAVGSFALNASTGSVTIGLTGDNFAAHAHTHAGGALASNAAAFDSADDGDSDVANTALPPYVNMIFCKKD